MVRRMEPVLAVLLVLSISGLVLMGCASGRVRVEDEKGSVEVDVYHKDRYYRGTLPDIPPGHMPPPGQCRIWMPGIPPGQQPPPGNCWDLERQVPPGAWLIRGR